MVKSTVTALAFGLALASTPVFAGNPPPTIKADAPNRYIVKKGDTLWAIAGKYLDKPTRWREIWATNKQIKNPNLIYPNDVLVLCLVQGQTLVGIDTGEGCAGVEKNMDSAAKVAADLPAPATQAAEITALTASEIGVPAIPLSNIKQWLTRAVIVSPNDFANTPYVLASKDGSTIAAVGDTIYVRGAPLIVGQRYGIYRKGEPYVDVLTGQVLGLETLQVAAGVVNSVAANGVISLQIKEVYGSEVHEGDHVFVEVDAPIPGVFYPAPATLLRSGSIVRTMDEMGKAAKGSVVAVNLGAKDGMRPGYVFDAYKRGKLVRDTSDQDKPVRLPNELSGQLMIFKVFNNISYAYVLGAEVPLEVGDYLLPPKF